MVREIQYGFNYSVHTDLVLKPPCDLGRFDFDDYSYCIRVLNTIDKYMSFLYVQL